MNKLAACLLAVGIFALGNTIGFFLGRMRNGKTAPVEVAASDVFTRTTDAYSALQTLRMGDTNSVIEQWEQELDLGILSLAELLEQAPTNPQNQRYRRLLNRLSEYRKKYPRQADFPAKDAAIRRTLDSYAPEKQSVKTR